MVNAIYVNSTGNLTFEDVTLTGARSQQGINLNDPKFHLPRLDGLGLWPSLVMDINSVVRFELECGWHAACG